LRLLFVAHDLAYPRSRGHDICGYNVMRALAQLGHHVGLLTIDEPSAKAIEGLRLAWRGTLPSVPYGTQPRPKLSRLQSVYASYFGVTEKRMLAVASASSLFDADAIIGTGPDIPPYLAATAAPRVWYVGDEWVSHYTSLVQLRRIDTWHNLKTAAVWGLYERAFAPALDRIWVVSDREARNMRRWAATDRVDSMPNGVDSDYFIPMGVPERPNSAVFWGRLDFAPNQQALDWFCREVWPELRRRVADAEFTIIGFNAGDDVHRLTTIAGVKVMPDVEDLRPVVAASQVVVMPFHSGGGIKNKLLEAASMAKPIICTSMACHGLRGNPPLTVVDSASAWVDAVERVWRDSAALRQNGSAAREWVVREHSWIRTAQDALRTLIPAREDAASS
jgi:glycosyltransferase involved in cell wall biosynthesis